MGSSAPADMDEQNSNFDQHKNLNVDLCFQLVFPYLNVSDLVNVADSCKWLKHLAELTFCEKYGRAWIFILDPIRRSSNQLEEVHHFNQESVLDAKRCFGFLRCFGHMIFNLKLNYDRSSALLSSRLNEYVTKYCTSVHQIEFSSNLRRPSADNIILLLDSCKSLGKISFFPPKNKIDYKKFIRLLNLRSNLSMSIDEDSSNLKFICYKLIKTHCTNCK